MKRFIRKLSTLLCVLVLLSSSAGASAYLKETTVFIKNINMKINTQTMSEIEAILYKDRLYLPIRFVSEKLNHSIFWDEPTSTVTIKDSQNFHNFDEANPLNHEQFIYGEIKSIDKESRKITIEEHIDDHSMYVAPDIMVTKDVIVILQRNNKHMNIDFEDLLVGDVAGLVINKDGLARGIILNE